MTSLIEPGSQKRSPAWLTLSGFVLLILSFSWLRLEDTDEKYVLAYAAAVNAWLATRYIARQSPAVRRSILRHVLVGSLAGLAIIPVTVSLMALKTGLHGHGTPDFTIEQILSVMNRWYIWGSAGLLLGLLSGITCKFNSQ